MTLFRLATSTACVAAVLLAVGGWSGSRLMAADVPPAAVPAPNDVDAQYEAVLAQMKKPVAGGVLVTEIGPGSPAGAAGLRGGDIITTLGGEEVRDLKSLRQRIADLLAAAVTDEREKKVVLVVRRQILHRSPKDPPPMIQTVTLQVPREPLGIRAIEVEAGVAAALNPPANPRGSIKLAWDDLRQLQNAGGDLGQVGWFRTYDSQSNWLGWQARAADPAADDTIAGKVEVARIEPQAKGYAVVATETISFRLRTGDFATAPAFVLESADVVTTASGIENKTTARRAGASLRTQTDIRYPNRIEGPFKSESACPVNAIIPAAVPLVAAAMPQQNGAVLALHLMSARDFIARPGYVLVTRGRQPLPKQEDVLAVTPTTAPAATAWRVDLMHCGIVTDTYWLNDQRRLVRADTISGTSITSQRVPSETEARVPVYQKTIK
jgi:hypothetical protein